MHVALTNCADPLDANSVADFHSRSFCSRSELYNISDTLVATNLALLRWERQSSPAVGHYAEITMANARVGAEFNRLTQIPIESKEIQSYRLTNTSPGPGSGVSTSSIFVWSFPGSE
jgi:hypothetical protein